MNKQSLMLRNRNQRKYLLLAIFYIILTLSLLALIFKFGLTGAVKISEFIQKTNPAVESDLYENVLASPQLYPLPEATNSATLIVSGYSLPNHSVDVYMNDLNVRSFEVDSEGKFSGLISLSLGLNKIYALTRDVKERTSSPSPSWTVFYSNSPPYLEITDPAKDSLIKGSGNISLKGKISLTSKVTVNDHSVITFPDEEKRYGLFSYPVKLAPGENKFKIVCSDPAENKTEIEWIIRYQP